jgi:hypothetical protein
MAKREPPSRPQKPRAVVVGTIDMRTVLLESTYQRAVGADRSEARMALRVISSSTTRGRPEASVFLMGFLVSLPPDDWEMRIEAVEALKYTRTERCAALLFSELRRVKGSNTTRSYLSAIMDVLDKFPDELVRDRFAELAADKSFSQKARAKYRRLAGLEKPVTLRWEWDDDEVWDDDSERE